MINKRYLNIVTAVLVAIFLSAQFHPGGRIVLLFEIDQVEALVKSEVLENNQKNHNFLCISLKNIIVPVLCCQIVDLIKADRVDFCQNQINSQKICNHSPPCRHNFLA